ncbi:glycosyltransferase family 4 protein [Henriciella sp.]|uniref:glycosyltransferase family 4 protein n=1 Tax=Henriciella sp. TaxID=1968823 RepID=UPI00260C1770|nr:glycosyltransferase family 4 protein [Henriciella sp.]
MTELQYIDSAAKAPIDGLQEQPPLEVALLTWEYPPIPTAKGRVACEVAHSLAQHGANVRVFTMDRQDRVGTDSERIEVIGCAGRITGLRRLMRKVPGLDHVAAAAAFRERVHEEHARRPFDIIESTNHGAPAAMLMDCGLPIVIRNTTPYALDNAEEQGWRARLSAYVASGMEARCIARSDAVISNSRAHASMIRDWYDIKPGHIHSVTPLSVDPQLSRIGDNSPFPPAHARLRLARIGDASGRSGFHDTLLAFDRIVDGLARQSKPAPELHLVGLEKGDLETAVAELELSKAARDQIYDYGRLPDRAMGHVLARCQCILAPSHYKSFGSVYHEAAAFGRPLVASADDPAAREYIERSGCGILADSCSPEDIAEAVLELQADRPRQLACRRKGHELAANWTREGLGARTVQVYRRAMNLGEIELPGLQPAGSRAYDRKLA